MQTIAYSRPMQYATLHVIMRKTGLGRPARRRVGGCGAQSLYIPVRSVIYDRAEFAGAQ